MGMQPLCRSHVGFGSRLLWSAFCGRVVSCDLNMVHESPFYVYLALAEKKTLELPNSVTKSSRFWFWKKWWRAWPTASAPFAQVSIIIFSNSMSKTSTRMFKFTLHASKKMLESTAPWAWSTQRWNWNWLPPKSGTSSLGLVTFSRSTEEVAPWNFVMSWFQIPHNFLSSPPARISASAKNCSRSWMLESHIAKEKKLQKHWKQADELTYDGAWC